MLYQDTLPSGRDVRIAGGTGPLGRLCNVKEADGGGFDCIATPRAAEVLMLCDRLEG